MKLKKFQKYYIRFLFKTNVAIDINTAQKSFYNKFNTNLKLSRDEITKEKHLGLGTYNNLDIISLCKKLSTEDKYIKINAVDIFYEFTNNNKKEKREKNVIFITTEMMHEKLSDKDIDNYFIDTTYKIIPKHYKRYKMMTISCSEKKTNNTYIACLILLKYEDHISFTKIFKYLHEMFNFNPKVVHIDYSKPLLKALLTENLFNEKPIIIHCFFHFVENIVKYMKKYGIIKKKYK